MNENLPEKPKPGSFEPLLPKQLPPNDIPPSVKTFFLAGEFLSDIPENEEQIRRIVKDLRMTNVAIDILKSGDDTLLAKSTQESISNSSARTEEEIQVLHPQPLQTIEPQSYEVWASKWISYPVILLLSKEMREEWLGDLYEKNQGMLEKGYPLWHINLMNLLWSIFLVMSALKIKISDVISLPKFKQD